MTPAPLFTSVAPNSGRLMHWWIVKQREGDELFNTCAHELACQTYVYIGLYWLLWVQEASRYNSDHFLSMTL